MKINNIILQDYLLEQSRITHQSDLERNYHVFYQLTAAASRDPSLAEKYQIKSPKTYHYLSQSGCTSLDGVDDAAKVDALVLLLMFVFDKIFLIYSLMHFVWRLKLFKFHPKLQMQYSPFFLQSCGWVTSSFR